MADDKVVLEPMEITKTSRSWFSFTGTVQPCLAELIGVLLFVFVGCLAVQDGPLGLGSSSPAAIAVAVAHGFIIALLITSFGNISGGHFNPAVTLGVWIAGEIQPLLALGYLFSQCTGAVLGAACCRGVLSHAVKDMSITAYEQINGGAHMLADNVDPGRGILCEMLLTTVLVTTVLMTAVDSKTKSSLAPLAIGFAVTVCILAGINVTGASMNPARSFGPAVVISYYNPAVWNHHYVYWVGPALGSGLSGFLYRFLFASSDKRLILKED